MSRKKQAIPYGLYLKKVRVHLVEVMGADRTTCPTGYDAVKMLASIKFNETLEGKAEARRWLVNMARSGELAGWPVKYKGDAKKKDAPSIGAHSKYVDYIDNSLKWQKIRAAILDRDGHRCKKCRNNRDLHVHHLTYEHLFNEENYPQDLITLCKGCHKALHNSKDKDKLNSQLRAIVPKALKTISLVFSEAELEMMRANRKTAAQSRSISKNLAKSTALSIDELVKDITRDEAQRLICILDALIKLSSIRSMRTLSNGIMSKLIKKFGLK